MLNATPLGQRCGMKVSELCLGTMNFGKPGRGQHGDWTIDIDAARPIFKSALDNGLFFFDCADVYGVGACEETVGELLRELTRRENYVLGTKIAMPMGRGPNLSGLSRKHILEGVDASLSRLGHHYIDLLVIHRHPHGVMMNPTIPVEETMEALHDVVKSGKVMYIGASSMWTWQFAELQHIAECNGWTKFVSMQNHYNLVYREEEREMNPYCVHTGIALTPWSPLARGILTGRYQGNFDSGTSARSSGRDRNRTEGLYRGEAVFSIVERVAEVANRLGKEPAQIAVAWLMNKPEVTSPIVGVSNLKQLEQLLDAASIELSEEDISYLEELYQPVDNLLSLGGS